MNRQISNMINVMGCLSHDPLVAPHGDLISLPMPSAMVGPVVLAVPSDKRPCASVAPSMHFVSTQRLANDNRASRIDNAARANLEALPAPSGKPLQAVPHT